MCPAKKSQTIVAPELDDDETKVFDESEEEIIPYRYSITSYGADYPVDLLVQRLGSDIIFIPPFQRSYVWTYKMASRFIESLLLGLPVPGIFLSKEPDTGKSLIIDGHQRLKTLQFFYQGQFGGREFALRDVQPTFEGKTYKILKEEDRLRLGDSIIHATIVKQDEPSDDQSSIFHIYERLNTGGMLLQSQEIRSCIYFGPFEQFLRVMNEHPGWRAIYGKPSKRLKDQELILRFYALYFHLKSYERPIKEFLNRFMGANRHMKLFSEEILRKTFVPPIEMISFSLGSQAFRPERALNAAVFDAVMVGLARRLEKGPCAKPKKFVDAYNRLLESSEFLDNTRTGTSGVPIVHKRIEMATQAFISIK